jgi:hypothetical protein
LNLRRPEGLSWTLAVAATKLAVQTLYDSLEENMDALLLNKRSEAIYDMVEISMLVIKSQRSVVVAKISRKVNSLTSAER